MMISFYLKELRYNNNMKNRDLFDTIMFVTLSGSFLSIITWILIDMIKEL